MAGVLDNRALHLVRKAAALFATKAAAVRDRSSVPFAAPGIEDRAVIRKTIEFAILGLIGSRNNVSFGLISGFARLPSIGGRKVNPRSNTSGLGQDGPWHGLAGI